MAVRKIGEGMGLEGVASVRDVGKALGGWGEVGAGVDEAVCMKLILLKVRGAPSDRAIDDVDDEFAVTITAPAGSSQVVAFVATFS